MARGTLQLAWLNRGESGVEHYHVMFGVDGETRTVRARSIRGRTNLSFLLERDLKVGDQRTSRVLAELNTSGQAIVMASMSQNRS